MDQRILAGTALVMNLLDGIFTLTFLQWGVADELNPFMAWAYVCSPGLFLGVKLITVQTAVVALLALARLRLARAGLLLSAALYLGIVVYHLTFLFEVFAS
jgi:hypothetical protein